MKIGLLTLFAFFCLKAAKAQDVYFTWERHIARVSGLHDMEGYYIGVDHSGNVYLAGNFNNTMDVDPGAATYNLTGQWDHIFLIKLDPAGNFVWARNIGGDRITNCRNITVDGNGDVFLCGVFSGTTDFDPGPGTFNLTAPYTPGQENMDFFVTKLNTQGDFQWALATGGLNHDQAASMALDPAGNLLVTGSFIGVVDFHPGTPVWNLGSDGVSNTFLAKYDNGGTIQWAKCLSGNQSGFGTCIRSDLSGNIYLSGKFGGTVDFDPGPGIHSLSVPYYSSTPFLEKLDPAGNFLWVRQNAPSQAFEVDAQGNVVAYDANMNYNATLSKYSTAGDPLWQKTMGGRPPLGMLGSSPVRLDAAGNIFVCGEFYATQDFDPGPGVYNLTSPAVYNIPNAFISRLDPNGDFVWAKSLSSVVANYPTGLTLDTAGNVYTCGVFWGYIDFDPGPASYMQWPGGLGGDAFVHKMSRCAQASYANMSVTACTSYTLNGHLYTQSGTFVQTLPNAGGCDSILTLNLTLQGAQTTLYDTACQSLTWLGHTYTTSGTYRDTFQTSGGCDSIVTLNLVIRPSSASTVQATICEGQSYEGYTTAGTYTNSFVSANGCDSIRTLQLTVRPRKHSLLTATICAGETFLGHSSGGTYTDTLVSATGCDSIRTLQLQVLPRYERSWDTTLCAGQSFLGHSLPGTYHDTLHAVTGCDSILIVRLDVASLPHPQLGADTALCTGDSLVLHGGSAQAWLWQNGSTRESFTVHGAGLYTVAATNACGTVTDAINIRQQDCQVFFPNAFTPNGDGHNDRFGILNGYHLKDYQLIIYNRWGRKVFESHNPLAGWDGSSGGRLLDSGVFVWQSSFTENGLRRSLKGTVTLIR